jgi:agmatine deiminase
MQKKSGQLPAIEEPLETPASQGYAMPAEWESHDATSIAWPHNEEDWPGKFAPIPWIYAEIVRLIARGERVHIFVQPSKNNRVADEVRDPAFGVNRAAG